MPEYEFDCAILTPTRLRKQNAQRLIDSVGDTIAGKTVVVLGIDDDDFDTYRGLRCGPHVRIERATRRTVPQWTNDLAAKYKGSARLLASFGDDHAPETIGWDVRALEVIETMKGVGLVYGDDTLQGINLPTAPIVSSNVIDAIGYMFLPELIHYFADNVLKDLMVAAGRIVYLPDIIIRHYHYAFGTAVRDQTYAEAEPHWNHDQEQYVNWGRYAEDRQKHTLAGDVRKVQALVV